MKISQSRKQSAIYRCRQFVLMSLIPFILAWLSIYLELVEAHLNWMFLYGYGAFQLAIFCWLFLFNRGDVKIDEYAIEINDESIIYHHMADQTQIFLNEIIKYRVSGRFFRSVSFYGEKGCVLSIDLNLFSKSQRKQLVAKLNAVFP